MYPNIVSHFIFSSIFSRLNVKSILHPLVQGGRKSLQGTKGLRKRLGASKLGTKPAFRAGKSE